MYCGTMSVSYTHLDVYKRQVLRSPCEPCFGCASIRSYLFCDEERQIVSLVFRQIAKGSGMFSLKETGK